MLELSQARRSASSTKNGLVAPRREAYRRRHERLRAILPHRGRQRDRDRALDAAHPARLEYTLADVKAVPHLSTSARALWSDKYLYLGYEAPYTELTTAATPQEDERLGLWNDDVVEAFIAPDADEPRRYTEYEWAPNGEQLDLRIDFAEKDFPWSSGMESAVTVDRDLKVWRTEVRIPLSVISDSAPSAGTRWRLNLYRHDNANDVFLAFSPTLTRTAHTPEKFGWLEFGE